MSMGSRAGRTSKLEMFIDVGPQAFAALRVQAFEDSGRH
jgi:hypothetical protein